MLNKKGLTLVEVLIAMVVLLLVSLAMLQTALVSIDSNMRNVLRDEAVNIAEMRMNEARNILFDSFPSSGTNIEPTGPNLYTSYGGPATLAACGNPPISDSTYPVQINRSVRSIVAFPFGTRLTVNSTLGSDDRQITILVRWVYRNECYTHSISTIVRRQ